MIKRKLGVVGLLKSCIGIFVLCNNATGATVTAYSDNLYDLEDSFYGRFQKISRNGEKIALQQYLPYDGGVDTRSYIISDNKKILISGESEKTFISDLSGDGSMALGFFQSSENYLIPAVWTGSNFEKFVIIKHQIDNSVSSFLPEAISSDGKTIVGNVYESSQPKAKGVIWSGDNWNDLKILDQDSTITSLSEDGSLVGGQNRDQATIWKGNNWNESVSIGQHENVANELSRKFSTNIKSTEIESFVTTMSADGSVVAGEVNYMNSSEAGNSNEYKSHSGIIWYGVDWKSFTFVPSVDSQLYNTQIFSITPDGKIAAGWSFAYSQETLQQISRATLWFGDEWKDALDLGSFTSDHKGNSEARSVVRDIKDGSVIIVGTAQTDSSEQHPVIWKVTGTDLDKVAAANKESNSETPSKNQESQVEDQKSDSGNLSVSVGDGTPLKSKDGQKLEITKVDVYNNDLAVGQLASDMASLVQLQRERMYRLNENCMSFTKDNCWNLMTGVRGGDGKNDVFSGFAFGHKFGEKFAAGFVLDHTLYNRNPSSFGNKNNNTGIGLNATFFKKSEADVLYVTLSVSYSKTNLSIARENIGYTEPAKGDSDLKSYSFSLKTGQEHKSISDNAEYGWFAGIRNQNVSLSEWKEKNAAFPFTWDKVNYRRTEIFFGVDTKKSLTSNISWNSYAVLNQKISDSGIKVNAHNNWLGERESVIHPKSQTWQVGSGVSYNINQNVTLALMPAISKSLTGSSVWSGTLSLEGSF